MSMVGAGKRRSGLKNNLGFVTVIQSTQHGLIWNSRRVRATELLPDPLDIFFRGLRYRQSARYARNNRQLACNQRSNCGKRSPDDHPFSFLIPDRDSIFSLELDQAVAAMGARVLRTPPRAPKANAVCERVVGTIRRECLDFLIPLGQRHLKQSLNRWILHYNHGRVHMSLGPGIPAPLNPSPPHSEHRHRLPPGHRVLRKAVLGGLHHEYWLEKAAA